MCVTEKSEMFVRKTYASQLVSAVAAHATSNSVARVTQRSGRSPSNMHWFNLHEIDRSEELARGPIPKLHYLRLAEKSGIPVPQTLWCPANTAIEPQSDPLDATNISQRITFPCIIRSGSPTEDTTLTSNAGRFLSLKVERAEDFRSALHQVALSLPVDYTGLLGVVFVQPWIGAKTAGVTFFDGFYYEEASGHATNVGVTSGQERGEVRRGHLERNSNHSAWLTKVHAILGVPVDIEWAQPETGPRILLQVRPALFPITRQETLSLANHKEILGDPPSPWMVGILAEVGREVMGYYEAIDPRVKTWNETYAIECAGRDWLNFSAFFRLMDLWGLPRTMVTEGVGGKSTNPADGHILFGRFFRSIPRLCKLQWANFRAILKIREGLQRLDSELNQAKTLLDLQQLNARALSFAIQTNFAINGMLAGISKVRGVLNLNGAARLITQEMMGEYAKLAAQPELKDRLEGLDLWLEKFGHRGPLESDPWQPRFIELRPQLAQSLQSGPSRTNHLPVKRSGILKFLSRPFFLVDECRESFRDGLMKWWLKLRTRILELARLAPLDDPSDVFFLRSQDLAGNPEGWRQIAALRRGQWQRDSRLQLPTTGSRAEIETAIVECHPQSSDLQSGLFRGIGLGTKMVEGTVVRGDSLTSVLARQDWPERPILVVGALEPSWAVIFPRCVAVVSELGGELSHASILLREAGISAVINAQSIFGSVQDGQLLRVDPLRSEVALMCSEVSCSKHHLARR